MFNIKWVFILEKNYEFAKNSSVFQKVMWLYSTIL